MHEHYLSALPIHEDAYIYSHLVEDLKEHNRSVLKRNLELN